MAEEQSVSAKVTPEFVRTVALFKDRGMGVEEWNGAGGIRKGQAV